MYSFVVKIVELPGPDQYELKVDEDWLTIKNLPHIKHMGVLLSDYNDRVVTGISTGGAHVFAIETAADLQQREVQEILASKTCVVRLTKIVYKNFNAMYQLIIGIDLSGV